MPLWKADPFLIGRPIGTSHGGSGSRTVPHHVSGNARREVGRAASAEPGELPVPGHACSLRLVVSPAQRLTVGEGSPTAAAVRVDVVRLEPPGLAAAPGHPPVMLASAAGSGQDRDLVSPWEGAHRIAPVHGMNY